MGDLHTMVKIVSPKGFETTVEIDDMRVASLLCNLYTAGGSDKRTAEAMAASRGLLEGKAISKDGWTLTPIK